MSKIDKWGNSLGLRIPSAIVKQMGFEAGMVVDMNCVDDKLVMSKRTSWPLKDCFLK